MPETESTIFSLPFALLTSIALVGCVDAGRAYDDYASRVTDAGIEVEVDGAIVSELPNIDGDWLFAVRPGLPEDRILQFKTVLAMTPVTENTGALDISAQPLAVTDRAEVGNPFEAEAQDVASDTSFDILFEGMLPAAANPVSGSNAAVDAVLHGSIHSEGFLCGTLTGTAGALTLDGACPGPTCTTWAAVRIDGGTLPSPIFNCDSDPGL
jgi:hypothetical protein